MSIEVIKTKTGTTYKARLPRSYPGEKSKNFTRKADAEAWESRKLTELAQAEALGLEMRPDVTLATFAREWLADRVIPSKAPSTVVGWTHFVEKRLIPYIGETKLKAINETHAAIVMRKMKALGNSPKTINDCIGVLIAILRYAEKNSYIVKCRISGEIKLPVPPKPSIFWSKEEAETFLTANMDDPLLAVYILVLNTGLRRGMIAGMTWENVSFERNQIEITKSRGRYGLRTTKNNKRLVLSMNPVVKDVLERLYADRKSEFVFADADGTPINPLHLYRQIKKAQERAGIPIEKRTTFHDTRHVFASLFANLSNGDLFTLCALLGHSSVKMTEIYSHHNPNHLAAAANVVVLRPRGHDYPKSTPQDSMEEKSRVASAT